MFYRVLGVSILSNLIDTSELKFFEAPLKTVSDNVIRQINTDIVGNSGVGFGAINPYLYNKTCLLNCHLNIQSMTGGAYIDRADEGSGSIDANKLSAIGQPLAVFKHTSNNPSNPLTFGTPNIDDYAIYIEVAPLSDYPSSTAFYDNVEMIGTGYKTVRNSKDYPYTTPFDIMGKLALGVVNKQSNLEPLPTNEYDNWVYVKKFVVYNRAEGVESARIALTKNPLENSNILPCVLFNCQTLYHYRYNSGRPKAYVFNNSFQGLIIANLMTQYSPLWQLYNWRFINVQKPDVDVDGFLRYITQFNHLSSLGDNIKLLKRYNSADTQHLVKWIAAGKLNQPEFIYQDWRPQNTTGVLAFKTIDDIKWLLADWGFVKVSDDLDVVQNMPSELFPGYTPPEGEFNPDGGDNTGYDDNNPIGDIPSYPDNTSDTITPTTPNISAINAASVYALNLNSVKQMLNWLMTENFTKNISELFSDKLSALDDLKLFPFDVVNHDNLHVEASDTLTLANVSDNIPCHKILPNYNCIINGGSYHYTAYWGNYNDYTAASYYLYVPYGGIVELSPSHVVNRDLSIKYALDIMTGNATAIIYSNGVLVKTVPCQMGQTIPITYTNTNQREIRNALTALNAGTSIINMAAGKTDILGGVLGIVNSTATTALTNPLKIGSIGNFSSGTSLIMPQNPFLVISRTQQSIPADRQNVIGIPSNINTKISDFVGSGYVQINAAHITTTATTDEQNQIINLLRGGIFL